jgi:hypothetical protein
MLRRHRVEGASVVGVSSGFQESSNAGCAGNSQGRFRIPHPFHPLGGSEYELVTPVNLDLF